MTVSTKAAILIATVVIVLIAATVTPLVLVFTSKNDGSTVLHEAPVFNVPPWLIVETEISSLNVPYPNTTFTRTDDYVPVNNSSNVLSINYHGGATPDLSGGCIVHTSSNGTSIEVTFFTLPIGFGDGDITHQSIHASGKRVTSLVTRGLYTTKALVLLSSYADLLPSTQPVSHLYGISDSGNWAQVPSSTLNYVVPLGLATIPIGTVALVTDTDPTNSNYLHTWVFDEGGTRDMSGWSLISSLSLGGGNVHLVTADIAQAAGTIVAVTSSAPDMNYVRTITLHTWTYQNGSGGDGDSYKGWTDDHTTQVILDSNTIVERSVTAQPDGTYERVLIGPLGSRMVILSTCVYKRVAKLSLWIHVDNAWVQSDLLEFSGHSVTDIRMSECTRAISVMRDMLLAVYRIDPNNFTIIDSLKFGDNDDNSSLPLIGNAVSMNTEPPKSHGTDVNNIAGGDFALTVWSYSSTNGDVVVNRHKQA